LVDARSDHVVVALSDGRVLVVGGRAGVIGELIYLNTAEIWRP
jgi:hypothetical protein